MSSRETELYKDKVEVSLDGRQIFYLFFGGAMIVGMVFVLGVLVGRRVEARGHVDRARTHTAADPLAALDRLEGHEGLSFRGSLTGKDQPTEVEQAIAERAATTGTAPAVAKAEVKADVKPEVKAEVKAEVKPAPKPEVKPAPKPEVKVVAAPAPEVKPAAKPAAKPEAATEDTDEPKPVTKPAEVTSRYTVQLSSFQDKAEAEAFLSAVKAKGYEARITPAEVGGKAWFRVRMGTYRSMEAAVTAKADFEKSASTAASIMKL